MLPDLIEAAEMSFFVSSATAANEWKCGRRAPAVIKRAEGRGKKTLNPAADDHTPGAVPACPSISFNPRWSEKIEHHRT